jgi:hypothetical protein
MIDRGMEIDIWLTGKQDNHAHHEKEGTEE